MNGEVGDAALLLAILHVLFAEARVDLSRARALGSGPLPDTLVFDPAVGGALATVRVR